MGKKSRRNRVAAAARTPQYESDPEQMESDNNLDELIDNSDEELSVDDNDMSDIPDDIDEEEEEIEEDDAEEIEEDEDDEQQEEEEEELDMEDDDELESQPPKKNNKAKNNKKRKKPQVYESEEEDFDDSDIEILRSKPMTKRQRAKLNDEGPEEYLELPMDTGKKRHLTEEEEALRKSEVARRRKNQSIQKAEKDKQDTINRLLKKQASKSKKVIKGDDIDDVSPAKKLQRLQDPYCLHYIQNQTKSTLNIPDKYTIAQVFGQEPPIVHGKKITTCEVEGCHAKKKYVAKKSGKVVCSLEHYKVVEV